MTIFICIVLFICLLGLGLIGGAALNQIKKNMNDVKKLKETVEDLEKQIEALKNK